MIKSFQLLFGFFLSIVIALPSKAQNILLNYKPEIGVEYTTEYDIQSIIDQEVMGIEQRTEAKTFLVINSKVIECYPEYCLIEMNYKRLALETTTPVFNMLIDSDSDDNENPINSTLKTLIGNSFFVKIGNNGGIISIEGIDSIINNIPNIVESESLFQTYKNLLKQSFGSENLLQYLESICLIYPDNKVKPGDTWFFNVIIQSPEMLFHQSTKATINGINKEHCRVNLVSTITPEVNSSVIDTLENTIVMEGKQVGEILIDCNTGVLSSGIINQDLSGELIHLIKGSENTIMSVPIKMKSSIHFKTSFH